MRLIRDPAGDDHDGYGRILRYVILAAGENFNATLIHATGTLPLFGAFPTLDKLSVYSWKPRRAPRAVGFGADDDRPCCATKASARR